MEKKLVALILIAVLVLGGVVLLPRELPYKFVVVNFGEFLIILAGFWVGLAAVKRFTFESAMGRSVFFISLGAFCWGVGNLIWMTYQLLIDPEMIPYPSLADLGYLAFIPLAAYGLYTLLKNIDFNFTPKALLKVTLLPLLVLVVCYFFFIRSKLASNDPLGIKLLNVAYPVGDVIFISFALVILSFAYGSFLFKPFAVISLGFLFQAAADFGFSYVISAGTYFTGHWVDVAWCLAFFCIGLGIQLLVEGQTKETGSSTKA